MDFHKLVSKLKEIEPVNVFNAQGKTTEVKPVQRVALSEDAQMRVLAGVSSILEEGRRISDRQDVVEAKKNNEYAIGMAAAKKQAGMSDKPAKGLPKKVIKKGHEIAKSIKRDESEIVDGDALVEDETSTEFKEKFKSMVEAKKDKMAKEKAMNKEKKVAEAKKPDVNPKDGIPDYAQDGKGSKDLGKGKTPAAKDGEKKESGKKGMSAAQAKYFGGKNESVDTKLPKTAMAAFNKTKGSVPFEKGVPSDKKRQVKESIERKLSFVECLKLVQESGGQQQIDPVDSALWNWAQRVAATKVGSGIRGDAYAAKVYESYGGEFQLYDVLAENQK